MADLFIPNKDKSPDGPSKQDYGIDMRAIELWARGGHGFPNFTGSGSPNGIINGTVGQWYENLVAPGGLWVFVGTNGTNQGWMQVGGGYTPGQVGGGYTGEFTGLGLELSIIADDTTGPGLVIITDTAAQDSGTNNRVEWEAQTDGSQTLTIQLGSTGQFTWKFQTGSGFTQGGFTLPDQSGGFSTIFINAGDPNGTLASFDTGDLCIDTTTPALWLATSPGGTTWAGVGGSGGGGPVSITGAGETSSPGDLLQTGGFTVDDTAVGDGFFVNTIGEVLIQGDNANLTDTGGGTSVGGSGLGFYSATPVPQPSAITHPTGGTTVDTQARVAIVAILNALGQAAGGVGVTA